MPQYLSTVHVMFEDLGHGRSRIIELTRHETKEARDGHVMSGKEYGTRQTFDRLEALISQLSSNN